MTLETLRDNPKRRDKVSIMTDLLDIMQEPHRLTHILYRSNMSYVQLVKYLDNLIEMDFIKKIDEPHRTYCITPNGKLFMNLIRGTNLKHSHSK